MPSHEDFSVTLDASVISMSDSANIVPYLYICIIASLQDGHPKFLPSSCDNKPFKITAAR